MRFFSGALGESARDGNATIPSGDSWVMVTVFLLSV
jgi:hypothetical protein